MNLELLTLLAILLFCLPCFTVAAVARTPSDTYWVGVGIADITGPAAEVNMMGYAHFEQTTEGIHTRVFACAFIFADGPESKNRFVFVSCDMGMMSQLVKLDVLKKLEQLYPGYYTAANVILSGTHTHSATAGYFQYFFVQFTSFGFVKESEEQFVRGIVDAIKKAHDSIQPAKLYLNTGELLNTQINRSPSAYLRNPQTERALYQHDTDTFMHLLRIDNIQGNPMGMINWYPLHCVSMNFSNRLISGDNKGYASQMFERVMEPHSLAGRNKFVAAFAQSFEGDVSPNTAGPRCIDTGLPCDYETSTCNGEQSKCIAFGPGKDMFESTKISGENQLRKALELFNEAADNGVKGDIRFIHQYCDMTNVTVDLGDGQTGKTCIPAMGYGFAGGTIDGPTKLPFGPQGTDASNPFVDSVRNLIAEPTPEMIKCHYPKPILLATGLVDFPFPWHPTIIDIQLAKVGQLVIAAVPGEFTTMAGRRLIRAITEAFADAGQTVQVVIAGLSNVYTHYIVTPEEYSRQRYEGASTIYGPYTLPAYIKLFTALTRALIKQEPVVEGPQPPYTKDKLWSLLPPVILDQPGSNSFGDVLKAPQFATYRPGDVVSVTLVGANPRNSMGTNLDTFMTVERWVTDNTWETVFTDAEWETRFRWQRESTLLGTSSVTLEWTVPANQMAGRYRLCYKGHAKSLLGYLRLISGCSPEIVVLSIIA